MMLWRVYQIHTILVWEADTYQVSVQTVEAVPCVRIVSWLGIL